MTEELKPCPFCGGEATFERIGNSRVSTIVNCCECGVSYEDGSTFNHASGWNTRPIEDALRSRIKELEEALQPFSKMAGVLFCRNFNNEDVVMHVELPARVGCGELTAKPFFAARQALNPGKEGKSK